jgi:hypothetical protein
MIERLDLVEAAPKEGEVWRDKIRTLRGRRCRSLVLEVITDGHECVVEHTTPNGDYRSKMEDFLRENERDVPPADGPRAGYPSFDGELSDFVASPRVTREMVEGDRSPVACASPRGVFFSCCLCGGLLPVQAQGPGPDLLERHRAWHDRLERLLEGSS